jgi:2-polyprenyl-3-methyl-5-hydroxy-6-metoxy-1,4-benzoquinol methylase
LFLRALDSRNWDRFGVETSAAAAKKTKAVIGTDRVFCGTLLESSWENSQFDIVTFWSALEHTNSPRLNLREARRIVKTGGSLIVQLPNAGSYQARLFTHDWFALDAPRHRYHFTLPVLEQLLSESGFNLYRTANFSKAHDSAALRQSLKARFGMRDLSALRYLQFYLLLAVLKPLDSAMSLFGRGPTLTVAARAI